MLQNLEKKGFYYANKGELKKAQKIFDYIIQAREYTPEVLHASGVILLYFGEIKRALGLIKLNAKNNLYKLSKEIVENIKEIKKYAEDFNLALSEFEGGSFKRVINILDEYRQRGFLTYDGQKLLAMAYLKQRRIDDCKNLLKEIDEIYPLNEFTKEMYKELDSYYKTKRFYENAALCLLALLAFFTLFLKGFKTKEVNKIQTKYVYYINDNFYELLKNYLEGDYYQFEKVKEQIDLRALNAKELMVYNLIQKEYEKVDSSYFYKQGLKLFRERNYKKAAEYFEIANSMKNDNYLKEHILFFLASSYKYLNKEKAVYYYNEYVNKYTTGCYRAEALYTLAMLLYDAPSAYEYALQIEEKYKDTIYYNSQIKKILEKGNKNFEK
ncbi:MAG: hypothetical protein N2486_09680 [Caloramator sp.]|nr:hypothetical protein [Caloramator sp.]